MKDLRLSLVQMRSELGRPDYNLEKMINIISDSESDIVCFPEACLTGYTSDRPERFSITASDDRVKRISNASADRGITVAFGFLERDGGKQHIAHAVTDGCGGFSIYRKTHLGKDESASLVPGDMISSFGTPKAKVGIQLCWESHFPEISCKLRKEGAEVILMPFASPMSGSRRKDIWMKHLPARAADNCVFVGAVNAVGDNGNGAVFGGGAIVLDPKGNILGEYFGTDENILTVDLSSKDKDVFSSNDSMGWRDYFLYRREELY